MVSFSCEACGDIFAKKKLDQHARKCRGAAFTCLDCNRTFGGSSYRDHTSCISEAQKYQGSLYRDPKANKSEKRKSMNGVGAMVPRKAYVEDAMEGDENSQAVAIVDVPPRAPTPPEQSELPPNVNVFDFLVSEETPNRMTTRKEVQASDGARMITEGRSPMSGQFPGNGMADSQYSQYSQYSNGDGSYYQQHGFSYGHAPLAPEFARYDSYNNLMDSQTSQAALMPPPPPYVTPAPKEHRKEKSDKKRKRHVEDLDLASSSAAKRPSSRDEMMLDAPKSAGRVLHSGLTGGLSKLVTDKDFYDDRIEAGPTPISPIKRSKRGDDREKEQKADRRKSSYTSYTTTTTTASKAPSSSTRHADDHHHRRERGHRSHRSLSPQQQSQKSSTHHSRRDDDRHRLERAPRDSFSSQDTSRPPHHQQRKAIDYHAPRPSSVQPSSTNQLATRSASPAADLFLSFVTKGPESERGYSVNKLLKRYHRERDARGEEEKGEVDKELWRALRLRRNGLGEVVVVLEGQ